MNNALEGVIISEDLSFAYALRAKCNEFHLNLSYISTNDELFDFIRLHNSGIMLIDTKYENFLTYLSLNNNFTKVFVMDNCKVDIEKYKAKEDFVLTIDELSNVMPEIKELEQRKQFKDIHMPSGFLNKYIIKNLADLKILSKYVGYSYLKDSVYEVFQLGSGTINFNNDIYAKVALNYNTTSSTIEKGIRSVIKKSFLSSEAVEIEEFKNKNITNSLLICYIVEKIKFEYFNDMLDSDKNDKTKDK